VTKSLIAIKSSSDQNTSENPREQDIIFTIRIGIPTSKLNLYTVQQPAPDTRSPTLNSIYLFASDMRVSPVHGFHPPHGKIVLPSALQAQELLIEASKRTHTAKNTHSS